MKNNYKIISPMGNDLSITDYREVTGVIEKRFAKDLIFNREGNNRNYQTWSTYPLELFNVFYGQKEITITNHSKVANFKKNFESKTKLKLEEIK
jgi:hypothetical protein